MLNVTAVTTLANGLKAMATQNTINAFVAGMAQPTPVAKPATSNNARRAAQTALMPATAIPQVGTVTVTPLGHSVQLSGLRARKIAWLRANTPCTRQAACAGMVAAGLTSAGTTPNGFLVVAARAGYITIA